MPIDASIPLGIVPVQIDDPNTVKTKQLQLRNLVLQNQQAEQAAANSKALGEAYKSAYGADGKLDRNALYGNLAAGGQGAAIPGIQKQFTEADAAQTKLDTEKFNLAKSKLDANAGALQSLLSLPPEQLNHDTVIGAIANQVRNGFMSQEEGVQLARGLPGNPQALRPYLTQLGIQTLSAKERLDALTPKYEYKDTGGSIQRVDVNPLTGQGGPATLTKTATPDAVLSNGTTIRGQDLTAATTRRGQDIAAKTAAADREQRAAQAASAIEKDEKGNLTIVDKTTGVARPVVGRDGKPVSLSGGVMDAKQALDLINQAEPLLKSSTGSWGGKGIDLLAGVFGATTEGRISAGKLRALEGMLVSKMPKMSGPQSDKDVAMYRQMAAEIGDDTVPYKRKQAALETVREIQERYAGMTPGSSKPTRAAGAVTPAAAPASAPVALPSGWSVKEN